MQNPIQKFCFYHDKKVALAFPVIELVYIVS